MSAILDVKDLTKRFGGLTAVNNVSFSVAEGQVVGLLGPNGSGKTTVLNMISGNLQPSGGAIQLRGSQIGGLSPHHVARHGVARTFQLVRILPSLTVVDNVVAALAFAKKPIWGEEATRQADAILKQVGLAGRGQEQPGQLTYIDQKRIELARAIASRPALLLLDEWLAGLNPTELRTGIGLIAGLGQSGMSILLVEHVMEAVRALCSRCVVMNAGTKIADGDTAVVLKEPEVIRAYLGAAHA
ncbi:MAG: ABC transporter ATP-binding protein [Pseudorhizobium sp.]